MGEESFHYYEPFPLGTDETPYRQIAGPEAVKTFTASGRTVLEVGGEQLAGLAQAAMRDVAHLLRPAHLAQLRAILDDREASDNDRYVALQLLKNANIAAGMVLPGCQDTGTAIIYGWKGQHVWTDGADDAALARGVFQAYREGNLRYSQMSALSLLAERNTGSNLPAEISIYSSQGDDYRFLFIAKGGGSANKSFLFQAPPSLLAADRLIEFLDEKIRSLGTQACPPYHLAVVVGGTSAEMTMKTVKLASTHHLDALPRQGGPHGQAFRDEDLEQTIMQRTQASGIGAQFGGKYFCHDVRVIRLPRHGGSLPIGIGVSCSADRQAKGLINREGVFLEALETDPAKYLPDVDETALGGTVIEVDLDRPMDAIRAQLSQYPVRTRLALNGTLIVARDAAHARLSERLAANGDLPDYFRQHPIYYAGPAKRPAGYASGSFGPTTAGRMDSFVEPFMAAGGSLITLAKGNRSREVRAACKQFGGFYLGSIGGPAAVLAKENIRAVKLVDFADLGMEAVWRIEVSDFPAFIVIDDKGNDFFASL